MGINLEAVPAVVSVMDPIDFSDIDLSLLFSEDPGLLDTVQESLANPDFFAEY